MSDAEPDDKDAVDADTDTTADESMTAERAERFGIGPGDVEVWDADGNRVEPTKGEGADDDEPESEPKPDATP